MAGKEVPRQSLDLQDNPEILSPPIVVAPLYRCASAVTVSGFVPQAELDLEIDGSIIATEPGGYPEPDGFTFRPIGPLEAGQKIRARQWRDGIPSGWSIPVEVRDAQEDYPTGLPRPEINPSPVYECGSRTGVSNLLIGCNVWIEADGSEVGRVKGAKKHQGINVNPDYGLSQEVRAFAELCDDPTPSSELYITQVPPNPLPVPMIDETYEESSQIRISNLVNGARFSLERDGINIGTWRTWGNASLIELSPRLSAGEVLTVRQKMCPGMESPPGGTTVQPCKDLPAPIVAPIQDGDTEIQIIQSAPSAIIKVFAGLNKIGEGGGSTIKLIRAVVKNEVINVIQSVGDCTGQTVWQIEVQCVAPPVTFNPADLNLFPVGYLNYDEGDLKGIVYYPAEDDGENKSFRERVTELGKIPIVFIAHGNHGIYYNPINRFSESCSNPGGWIEIPNHKGYTYLQEQLARMGIISVSIDCNATNCAPYGFSNIEDRADLILRTIDLFFTSSSSQLDLVNDRFSPEKAALLGHSRGGEAVILAANEAPAALNVEFKAVISLAPTDARLWSLGNSLLPGDYPFMTVLPAGDGDVASNDGSKFYDTQKPSPFKSQLYVHNTGHNYFNREWPNNDGIPVGTIISRTAHEEILSAYGIAFLRAYLLNHGTHDFLTYRQIPTGVASEYVYLSFEWADQIMVDDHEQNNSINTNTLGRSTQQIGGLFADEFYFSQIIGSVSSYNNSFYGNTIGMVAECKETGGTFRTELTSQEIDPEKTEIWVRVAEVYTGGPIPSNATSFDLGLEDAAGTIVWVNSDEVGGVPRPYERPSLIKTMLSTLRFPIKCFLESGRNFEARELRAILIRCNQAQRSPLAFDVLQLVQR